MKKIRIYFVAVIMMLLGLAVAIGISNVPIRAAYENVGVIDEAEVPDWVRGHEDAIKAKFLAAYNEHGFTVDPESTIKPLDLIRGTTDHKRYALVQQFGTEGILLLNDVKGKVLAVKDPVALAELDTLRDETDHNLAAQLLDVVESDGKTYYVTDRRNADGIFHIEAGAAVYLDKRIGIGTGTYSDIMWFEYYKAYQAATNYNESLGLPLEPVASYRYNTVDLNDNGTYKLSDGNKTRSEKLYTKQQFENGWIIQARMQKLINPDTGELGGHQESQHAAAPIKNDMYALVTGLADNSDLSLTGAPVSVEFLVDGIRYQNFEYGHVRVEEGIATFVLDWVVDSHGTQVPRRIGMSRSWDNWRVGSGDNAAKLGLLYERLRVAQNFRELVGQMVRDGRAPYRTDVDPTGDVDIFHNGQAAPVAGIWFSFKGGEGEFLGAANSFIYQYHWYHPAFELAPALNTAQFVDAKDNLGRPVDKWHQLYNARYQVFENGVGYIDGIEGPKAIIGDEFVTWLGAHESVHDAMLAHGIAEAVHTVEWVVNGEVIKTEQVPHGEAGTPPEVTPPEGFIFSGWDQEYDEILLPNRIINAVLGSETGTPQEGTYKFINYETDGETASFWYEDETKVIEVNEALYNAFRATKLTMGESIMTSGLPVYADATNLITTKFWFYIEGEEVKTKATIGQLPESVTSLIEIGSSEPVEIGKTEKNIIQDSFGDAYVFAFDRGGHNLGLPVGEAQIVNEVINPSQPDIFNHLIIQEFEHGKIIQQGYNRAAYPIYGDMLTFWEKAEAEGGAGGIDGIGIPTTRQFEYEGKVFQSFKYGYIIKEGETFTPTFGENPKQLDQFMQEVDSRFGRWTSRSDAKKADPDFEHEFLRTHEAYLEVHARWTKERNYIFGLIVEPNVIAWNTYGASQGFSMGSSTSDVWGQTRFTPIPYLSPFDSPHPVRSGILDSYAGLGGNAAGGPGYPLADDYTVEQTITHNNKEIKFDVMYQNFEKGYIRSYRFGDSLESEYFVGYHVDEEGKHINMETNEVEDTPEYILRGLEEGPEVSKDALIAKLNELKALRAQTKELVGDLDKLPSNQYFASKDTLTEIDSRIAALEALIARDDLTDEEIQDGLTQAQQAITRLNNNRQAGTGSPVEDPDVPAKKGLAGWAIALIVVGSLLVVGAVVFALIKFVFIKK